MSAVRVLLFSGCMLSILHLQAQSGSLKEKLEGKEKIGEIMHIVDQHYAEIEAGVRDRTDEPKYKHWARWAWYMSSRTDAQGRLVDVDQRVWDAHKNYQANSRMSNGNWQPIGPEAITGTHGSAIGIGRVDVIAFHPYDPDILYIGSPSGGLFRTSDGGYSWTALTDNLPSTAVSGIVVSHSDPNTIYILTGDGDAADDNYLIFRAGYFRKSAGVFVSHDAGHSWEPTGKLPISGGYGGHDLIQDPSNPEVLIAATTKGVCRTENGGISWTKVLSYNTYEVKFAPGWSDVVYATQRSFFYRSTDNGVTWSEGEEIGYSWEDSRVALAVSEDKPNKVYLLLGYGSGGSFGGMFESSNLGLTFTEVSSTPNIVESGCDGLGGNNQSEYDLALAVSHTNAQKILGAGINIWRSTTGGDTWLNATAGRCDTLTESTGYVHADVHDIEYSPLNGHVYVCTDGGVVKSENDGIDWINLSDGIAASQVYHMAGSLTEINNVMIGLQDNGVKRRDSNSSEWDQVLSADGFDCLYNYGGSTTGYLSWNSAVCKFWNNGSDWTNITPPGSSGFFPRVVSAIDDYAIVLAGYADIYRSTDYGDTWTNVGASGNWDIEQCPSNANRFYAAGALSPDTAFATDGNMWISNDKGLTWSEISGNPGYPTDNLRITDIEVRPSNADHVWITVGGFSDGVKVFQSINAGLSWVNLSGSIPNVPVNTIQVDVNNNAYIGTDIGVFYRAPGMNDWVPFWHQLPIIPVTDMELYESDGLLRASTFGRGVWESETYSTCPETYIIGADISGNQYFEASAYILGGAQISGGQNTSVIFKAGGHIELLPGFQVGAQCSFRGYLAPCGVAQIDD